jgi:DnaJ-domain-containing protein 1
MGIFERISRIVRSEVTAARGKAGDAFEEFDLPGGERKRRAPKGPGPPPGPPPAQQAPVDPIALAHFRLEVPEGSDFATVKKAYRKVMRRYHPDRHGTDPDKSKMANEVAAGLTEAYETLEKHLLGD